MQKKPKGRSPRLRGRNLRNLHIVNRHMLNYTVHMETFETTEIIVDASRLEKAIADRGFSSVKEFAEFIGLHRNTVGNYLSGNTSLPSGLARILAGLDLVPGDVLSLHPRPRRVSGLAIAPLIEGLRGCLPCAALVLFGSRARGSAKRYSDYDLGVFLPDALSFEAYSRLLDHVEEWNASSLSVAQLVDLTRADGSFLRALAEDLVFLAGSHAAWCELLNRAGVQIHE